MTHLIFAIFAGWTDLSVVSVVSTSIYLRNRSPLAVNSCVIIHCLEISCKEDQITSALNNSHTKADLFRF